MPARSDCAQKSGPIQRATAGPGLASPLRYQEIGHGYRTIWARIAPIFGIPPRRFVMPPGGRPPTLAEILAEHSGFVRRTLAYLGVLARHLPDVEQEVWRGVAKGLAGFDGVNLKGWIYGICERQAACYRRQEARRAEVLMATEDLDASETTDARGEESVTESDRRALLFELLATLEPQRRAVVVAYELEDTPMAEVAEALQIPVNTAWNRLRLGREDLRAAAKRRRDG